MFDDLLIHPRTLTQLEKFATNQSHGLILTGPEGSGKRAVAHVVAAILLGVDSSKLINYPYYSLIDPLDNSITIDEIRTLQKLLTLKTPSHRGSAIRRVITIIDAGRMRVEAQNAFLKSLEEPPEDTCIILTAESNGTLLSTILSRVHQIDILPVSFTMAKEYYDKRGIKAPDLARNYALSQGQAGLLHSLLQKDVQHPLKEWVEISKSILSKSSGERLLQTDELSKDKAGVFMLLNALNRIVHAALISASKQENTQAIKKWQNSTRVLQDTRQAMNHNANMKLLLDNLLLNL